ncbi:STAS domain-containing protein [Phaeospirillum tilakii]|uniref:Anti-sigma factor antagonist n=1 Tax=Phaeospirillum tilakii TaxID=741673 RepID=A0ABW5CB58_9PROT
MDYRFSEQGGVTHVALAGQLNFAANEDFQAIVERVTKLRGAKVVFDLSGLSHIDSVGLGLLYIAHEELASVNSKLVLQHPRDTVLRMLQLTEADETFEIIL